jgi:lysozyme
MRDALAIAAAIARPCEGLRLAPYRCPAGVLTVGYGSTQPSPTGSITLAEAERRLDGDLVSAYRAAISTSPALANVPLAAAAITDFVFNLGSGRYRGSTLRKRIDARDFRAAAVQIRKWVFGGGRKLPGLVTRRELEARLLEQCA